MKNESSDRLPIASNRKYSALGSIFQVKMPNVQGFNYAMCDMLTADVPVDLGDHQTSY